MVLHSLLLVPYHSWRFSHSRHHKATGHMTKDQVGWKGGEGDDDRSN